MLARPSCPVGPALPADLFCEHLFTPCMRLCMHVCELYTVNASLLDCARRDRPQLLGAAPGAAGGRRPPPRLHLDAADGGC